MKFVTKGIKLLVCLLMFNVIVFAQTDTLKFNFLQEELLLLYQDISNSKTEDKTNSEEIFFNKLAETLAIEGSVNYRFKKLKNIGVVESSDKKLVVYSWNIQDQFGYSKYYCIIQHYSKKEKATQTYPLKEDKSVFIQNQDHISSPENWYGALYYEIVETKHKGTNYYTLLGFNFNNILSNKKVVETVKISNTGKLVFVPQMFQVKNKRRNRIVWEFAERARMTLKYDPSLKMIVTDHLAPRKPSMEGQFQFYGPDGSYDGLEFMNGIWIQKSNINVAH